MPACFRSGNCSGAPKVGILVAGAPKVGILVAEAEAGAGDEEEEEKHELDT